MKDEKMHRINFDIPECDFKELQRAAWEKGWPISCLVRFLVCGSIEAWQHDASANPEVQREDI